MIIVNITLNALDGDSRILKELSSQKTIADKIIVFSINSNNKSNINYIEHIIACHRGGRICNVPGSGAVKQYFNFVVTILTHSRAFFNADIFHCNDLSALPFGWLGKFINRKAKLVYDAHEFETEQTENPNRLLQSLSVMFERFFVRYADAVINVSSGIADEYAKRYGIDRPHLVLNCPPYQESLKQNRFRDVFKIENSKTIFLYQGGLSAERGIEAILDAFVTTERRDVALVVMGNGPLEPYVLDASTRCPHIYYHRAVPFNDLLGYTASADVGILPYRNTCLNNYYCLPNKFFEYAMAGLPMLVSNLAEIGRLVHEYECGQVMEDETPEGIRAAIDSILSSDLERYAANSRTLARHYNWEEQEKVLLSVYKDVMSCAE